MVIENRLQDYSNKLSVIRDFREQSVNLSIQEVFFIFFQIQCIRSAVTA